MKDLAKIQYIQQFDLSIIQRNLAQIISGRAIIEEADEENGLITRILEDPNYNEIIDGHLYLHYLATQFTNDRNTILSEQEIVNSWQEINTYIGGHFGNDSLLSYNQIGIYNEFISQDNSTIDKLNFGQILLTLITEQYDDGIVDHSVVEEHLQGMMMLLPEYEEMRELGLEELLQLLNYTLTGYKSLMRLRGNDVDISQVMQDATDKINYTIGALSMNFNPDTSKDKRIPWNNQLSFMESITKLTKETRRKRESEGQEGKMIYLSDVIEPGFNNPSLENFLISLSRQFIRSFQRNLSEDDIDYIKSTHTVLDFLLEGSISFDRIAPALGGVNPNSNLPFEDMSQFVLSTLRESIYTLKSEDSWYSMVIKMLRTAIKVSDLVFVGDENTLE